MKLLENARRNNPEPAAFPGFNLRSCLDMPETNIGTSNWSLSVIVYQKTIFDRYYFRKSFCHLKTLETVVECNICLK